MTTLSSTCDNDEWEYDTYVASYFEWLKLMKHLGKCVSMGFNDLSHKAKCMQSNRELMVKKFKFFKEDDPKYKYIMQFV